MTRLRALVTTLTALVATQVPVTVATERQRLSPSVRDQIDKELVLLEQIRPHLDSSSTKSPTRLRNQENAAQRGRPSNLAFLELADQEKRDMVARYKAIGGETAIDEKDEDQNSAVNFLTQLQEQEADLSSARQYIEQFLAEKPQIVSQLSQPEATTPTTTTARESPEEQSKAQTSEDTESSFQKQFAKEWEIVKATPTDIGQRMIEFEAILDQPDANPDPDPQSQSYEGKEEPEAESEVDQETGEEVEIEVPAAEIEEIVEEVSEEHQEEDQERTKQYDELLDSVEQQKLALVIKWMSFQQTVIMSFLAAAALATLLICAYRSCKKEQAELLSQDEQMAGLVVAGSGITNSQRALNSCRSSPLTFRNLAARKGFVPGRTSEKLAFNRLGGSGSPPDHDYLYSDDTPSFHGQQFYQLGANRRK